MSNRQGQTGKAPLDRLCTLVTDGTHDSPKLQPEGVPFIKGKHISGGFVDLENCDFITEAEHLKAIKRSKPERGDILFSNIGSVGDAAFIATNRQFSIKNVALFKPDPTVVDNRYLYYVVIGPKFKGELLAKRSGVAQPFFSLEMLRSHEVDYHSNRHVQKQIASILSAYDDLIDNNERRIKILEEMAQNLYREWFVNFRFPDHDKVKMVDSPLGKIPEGWEVRTLSDLTTITMGQSPKSEFYNDTGDGLPFHQGVTNFGTRFPTNAMFSTAGNRIAEEGDVLFSVRAPVGRINVATAKMVLGRGLAGIRSSYGHQVFIFHQLSEMFEEEDTMGGGTIFKAVTKADMTDLKVLLPPEQLLVRFEDLATPALNQTGVLTQQNLLLRQTRDLLLPRLVSGQLDVSGLEIAMTEEPT